MLLSNLNLLAVAPGGVARLRELILTLAVQGKLVPQDPSDEPASELLKKIRAEKDRLIGEGKIKRDKPLPPSKAADGKSAEATLKDVKSGNSVTININDEETLDKFKDKRIQEGDEIRAKYDNAGNKSKSFKRTSGC